MALEFFYIIKIQELSLYEMNLVGKDRKNKQFDQMVNY